MVKNTLLHIVVSAILRVGTYCIIPILWEESSVVTFLYYDESDGWFVVRLKT